MSKFNMLGIASWVGSAVLFIFQSISTIMATKCTWKNYCLIDFLNEDQLDWVNSISVQVIQNAAQAIIAAPLMFLFLITGLFFFTLGAVFSK